MKNASELLAELRHQGIILWAEGDRLRFDAPKGALTPAIRDELSTRKAELLAFLHHQPNPARDTIPLLSPQDAYPLSFAQQRLWFLHRLEGQGLTYTTLAARRYRGVLDIEVLRESLAEIVRRHDILRTTFPTVGGQPVQMISPSPSWPLRVEALHATPDGPPESALQRWIAQDVGQPFDLENGPLWRVALLRQQADEHVLVVTMHHIISDAWSYEIFFRELAALYAASVDRRPSPLPTLPIQYADFAAWQRQWLQGEVLDQQLTFWQQQLAAAPALLTLPTDRPRPPMQSFRGAIYRQTLPEGLTAQLKSIGERFGVTLFMTLQAAFAVFLSRYSGQDDILVGTPIANRNRVEIEPLIGFFVNTLVLRTRLPGNPAFDEVLTQVRRTSLDAYEHQDLPFELLVEQLQPVRSLSHSPLFQVMFTLQNVPQQAGQLPGLTCSNEEAGWKVSPFDLTLVVQEQDQCLVSTWEYSTDLFHAQTIQRMAAHFEVLLAGLVTDPTQCVGALPLLTEAEKREVLAEWNHTQADYPRDMCIHHLFEAQAARTPHGVAVIADDASQLTYAELNGRANQLAHHLIRLRVGPDTLVGICMTRSVEMIVAMLGVLKAGGAYVPLDATYPAERLAYMLSDAKVKLLLTQAALLPRLPTHSSPSLCLDRDWSAVAESPTANPDCGVQPHHLAYVIYTSGSTGRPKGVMVPHRALVNHSTAMVRAYALRPQDRVLHFAAFSFDVAAEELFPTWQCGACVMMRPADRVMPLSELVRRIELHRITVLNLPAPYWHEWVLNLDAFKVPDSVRLVVVGSDKVLRERLSTWRAQVGDRVGWRNAYGVSEATITTTLYEPELSRPGIAAPGMTDAVPIGRPIANTQVYILDRFEQPVPIGVVGELYIGGDGLARGYLNQPGLTEERFVPHPLRSARRGADSRVYKTGDLARYLPDGNLDFLGRADEQVQIRGFRIEPGETAAVLSTHAEVREAVVAARDNALGEPRLIAYWIAADASQAASDMTTTLDRFLREQLPDYMMPSDFVKLDALPLTPSGKIDVQALPVPEARDGRSKTPPRTVTEDLLATMWRDILGIESVGIDDNFFDLGGHSLLITQLIYLIEEVLHVSLPVSRLFELPSLQAWADHIDAVAQASPAVHATKVKRDLYAEVRLDDAIRPSTQASVMEPETLQGVFLTGATGFLGAYLLSELLRQTTATIYCLVRAANPDDGHRRLQTALERFALWQPAFRSRLIPVIGDLSRPLLGLPEPQFHYLASQIDRIYHNGAWVNHIYPYAVLKPANVLGTQEALRLACQTRTKPFHFISTISVFPPEIGLARESDPLAYPELLENGYVESKWVADHLVQVARDRGLPVVIYRPSRVAGMTADGNIYVDDVFIRAQESAAQLGIAPDLETMEDNLVPIDFASRAIVYLSLQRHSLGKPIHIVNPQTTRMNDATEVLRDLGYAIDLLPIEAWQAELVQRAKYAPEVGLHPLLPFLSNRDFRQEKARITYGCDHMLDGLAPTHMTCPVIDRARLRAYFSELIRLGHLPPPPTVDGPASAPEGTGA